MGYVILALLIGVPLFELWLLVEVGSAIGGFEVILLSLFTAAAGLMLVRAQGLQMLADLSKQQSSGAKIGETLIHGLFLLMAGGMLMFPGLMTDAIGGLLLIPPVRLLLGKLGLAGVMARQAHMHGFSGRGPSRSETRTTIIIDGEVVDPTAPTPGSGPEVTPPPLNRPKP